ncbi:MAG: dihydropyrimidinase [Elusimicrobia bacterium CG06_land_8_20_14_3_00_38_11]|nr:MAG: dihydropyrimidinase [Elusimicrobia bacterium CG06_land_8_20_14_3_00_38_11]
MNLLVKNGTVITADKIFNADIFISGEKIAKIGKIQSRENCKIIDAKNKYIFPGVIDAHTHFGLKAYSSKTSDDFSSGTKSAASGGVTTVIDYAIPRTNETMFESVTRRKIEAKKSYVDYSFHSQIVNWNNQSQSDFIKLAAGSGIKSFKVFMPKTEGWGVGDYELLKILEFSKRFSALVEVHAESSPLIDGFTRSFVVRQKTAVSNFYYTRPNIAEEEAVNRAVFLAEKSGGNLYIVHTSAQGTVQIAAEARKRGVNVIVETCPQYLVLNKNVFEKKDGYLFATCPPVKLPSDNKALWEGIKSGIVKTVATDHCAFSKKDKQKAKNDFRNLRFGMPGVETSFPILFSEGVVKKRITLEKLARVTSQNPAKIFGLYPKKGCIKIGSDADLTIFDPKVKWRIDYRKLNTDCGWSPYQNMKITGKTVMTLLRGKIIYDNGKFTSGSGYGKFLKR